MILGTYFVGAIENLRGACVVTRFFHLAFVPIFPMGSYLQFTDVDGKTQRVSVPLHGRSVLIGYLRGVTAILVLMSLGGAVIGFTDPDDGLSLPAALVAVPASMIALLCVMSVGALSGRALQERTVYHATTGIGADPALFGDLRAAIYDTVMARVAATVRALPPTGYRPAHGDQAAQWARIACDPTVVNAQLVGDGLTVARLEWSVAKDAATMQQWTAVHHALWTRITDQFAGLLPPEKAVRSDPRVSVGFVGGIALTIAAIAFGAHPDFLATSEQRSTRRTQVAVRQGLAAPLSQRIEGAGRLTVAHFTSDFTAEASNGTIVLHRLLPDGGEEEIGLTTIADPFSTDLHTFATRVLDGEVRGLAGYTEGVRRDAVCNGQPAVESTGIVVERGERIAVRLCAFVRNGHGYSVYASVPANREAREAPLLQRVVNATEFAVEAPAAPRDVVPETPSPAGRTEPPTPPPAVAEPATPRRHHHRPRW